MGMRHLKKNLKQLPVSVSVGVDQVKQMVVMNFTWPIPWMSMPKGAAISFAESVLKHANQLPDEE